MASLVVVLNGYQNRLMLQQHKVLRPEIEKVSNYAKNSVTIKAIRVRKLKYIIPIIMYSGEDRVSSTLRYHSQFFLKCLSTLLGSKMARIRYMKNIKSVSIEKELCWCQTIEKN